MKFFNSASFQHKTLILAVAAIMAAVACFNAQALPLDAYAPQSVLASGNWVRVSVEKSGLYLLTTADLKRFGFNDPSKVVVYGYGGERIADLLSEATYVDDLVAAPSKATAKGVVFFARGVEKWDESTVDAGRFVHSLNPFSTTGSYFITEQANDSTRKALAADGTPNAGENARTTYIHTDYHETDAVSPGRSGHLLLGEDFRFTKSRNFTFPIVDPAETEGWFECRFATKSTAASQISFTANGTQLPTTKDDRVGATSSSNYATMTSTRHTFDLPQTNGDLTIGITFAGESVGLQGAWLDAISLNYPRRIALADGMALFSVDNPEVKLANATASTTVWDVTDAKHPFRLNTSAPDASGNLSWTNAYGGMRRYAAWDENGRFASPTIIGRVENQDIHGEEVPDMVIFSPRELMGQASRLADYHRQSADSLKVLVVDAQAVYNEFSSGTPDVGAFRRLLKMFYDRGQSGESSSKLRYALLFGRATHDNRQLTSDMKALREVNLPCWQTDDGLRESSSYMTDDFLAFLDDESGLKLGSDKLRVGVGRLPVGDVAEAKNIVEKLINFMTPRTTTATAKNGAWKNRVILTADDGDNGVHMTQTERQYDLMITSDGGDGMNYSKIYVDAYDEEGGMSKIGRELLHRSLREGVAWWNYVGHGNTQRLGSEGLIIYNDLSELTSRNPAFFYGATCSFLRWDGIEKSACELLLHNPSGGIIGAICPTREVYISENSYISNAIANSAFARDAQGRFPTVGDVMRNAKNNLFDSRGNYVADNTNKLRYVLMADPAMKLATPEQRVRLTRINGQPVVADGQPTIRARETVTLEGEIIDPSGSSLLADFDGQLTVQLYDAEESVTSQGRPSDDTNGEPITFEQQGALIFTGCDSIVAGRFNMTFAMPSEIADNFRPAMLNMYALDRSGREAMGVNRDFYVYGIDESAAPDTIPPTIDYAYLNHSSFNNGDAVNNSPMFIAAVSDNVGINISTAGVGRQITLKIDDRTSYNDLSSYYTPASDGTPGGAIAYPLSELSNGHHTLAFRVWDTAGNSATHTFDFNVRDDLSPQLFDVFTDANPAVDRANFYLSHNRPDQTVTVLLEIFNLNGRLEWSKSVTDRSDMFTTTPITWDLSNAAGHRVNRGIYLYRATLVADGKESKSMTKRIAVTAGS